MSYANRRYFTVENTPGTGALTVSTAVPGFFTMKSGDGGKLFDIVIREDGVGEEVDRNCTYTHGTTSMDRGTLEESTTGSRLSFTSAATVFCTESAASQQTAAKGFISGLQMSWNSAASMSVSSGAAYIEGTQTIIELPSALTASGLSLTANTWYHVYLYDNAGTAAIEVVTTAPTTPFYGTARSKTGDTSRRYVGSVFPSATNTLEKFNHSVNDGLIVYRDAAKATPFRRLSSGSAITSTTFDCSLVVPTTSRTMLAKCSNTDASINVCVGSGDDTQDGGSTSGYLLVAGGVRSVLPIPLSAAQLAAYDYNSSPTGAFFVDVCGYWYGR